MRIFDLLHLFTHSVFLYSRYNIYKSSVYYVGKTLFSALMDTYSIQNSDHIIIFARKGVIFTPRMWFLFKSMGHDPSKIHLLQGSLEEWKESGGDLETGFRAVPKAEDLDLSKKFKYVARDAPNVCDMQEVLKAVSLDDDDDDGTTVLDENALILDARGSSFARRGHIPGAVHIPYASFVDPDNMLQFKKKSDLLDVFTQAGVDVMDKRQIICSCGSGVSACHIFLALEECGRFVEDRRTVIYDGSWDEWGSDENTPKIL